MTKTEKIQTVLKAFFKLIAIIVIATVAIDLCFWALTGFEGEFACYPYTEGKLY